MGCINFINCTITNNQLNINLLTNYTCAKLVQLMQLNNFNRTNNKKLVQSSAVLMQPKSSIKPYK